MPSVEYLPVPQSAQMVLPLDSAIVPATQGVQTVAFVPEMEPGEHAVHVLEPEIEEYVPGAQSWQALDVPPLY